MNYLKQLPVVMMIMGALGLTFDVVEDQKAEQITPGEGTYEPAIPDPDISAPPRPK